VSLGAIATAVLIDGDGFLVPIVGKRRRIHGRQASADHEGRAEDDPERHVRALRVACEPGRPARLRTGDFQQMTSQVKQGPNRPSAEAAR
jgi:hypothetical protein